MLIVLPISGDCPDLPAPANGAVSMSGIIVGSTATYSCNEGFSLDGNVERTCEDDMWTGTEPVCLSKLLGNTQSVAYLLCSNSRDQTLYCYI